MTPDDIAHDAAQDGPQARRLACPIQEDALTCGERRCGCGWPEAPCRAMWPGEWAAQMLARHGLWNPAIRSVVP